MFLERDFILTADMTAQTAALFAEDDIMSVLFCRNSCPHAADTAANDQHFLWNSNGLCLLKGQLTVGIRIQCAPERASVDAAGEAVEAAHAVSDLIISSVSCLIWKFRIADQTTADLNDVCRTAFNDLFHHSRI